MIKKLKEMKWRHIKFSQYINLYSFRHALSVAITVVIAMVVAHFFYVNQITWVVLSAFLVCQTTRGTSVRQGFFLLISIIAAVFIAALINSNGHYPVLISIVISAFFIIGGSIISLDPFSKNSKGFLGFIFLIVLLLAIFFPIQMSLHTTAIEIILGGAIGMLVAYFILPVKIYTDFSQGLLPLLGLLITLSKSVLIYIDEEIQINFQDENNFNIQKLNIGQELQAQYGNYPGWVYEPGFNPKLRAGFRSFLINLEQLTEVLFSISYFFTNKIDTRLSKQLKVPLILALEKNIELLGIIKATLANEKMAETSSDYISDMAELENALRELVPANLALLDISPDYVALTSLVRNIKDSRELLLGLVAALPSD